MNDFIHFSDFIPQALRKYKLTREARATLICARFRGLMPSVVGDDLPEAVQPKFFKGGVLYVSVPSSIWAQRIYVHRHDLLMKLNLHLGQDWVKDLRTVVELA
jgi:predicted nucleic acid-binding Zn ribbon protein